MKLYTNQTVNLCVWKDCGASGALVFSYIRNWIKYNGKHGEVGTRLADHVWMFQTLDEIRFGLGGVLSKRTIQKAIASLEKEGYLIKGNFNSNPYNRTLWYAIGRDNPDAPSPDHPNAPSDDVRRRVKGFSDVSAARKAQKKAESEQKLNERRSRYQLQREEFIEMLFNADYSGTAADEEIDDDYDRSFKFTDCTEEQQRAIIEEYVDSCIHKGDKPNFKNFVHPNIQKVFANRHSMD